MPVIKGRISLGSGEFQYYQISSDFLEEFELEKYSTMAKIESLLSRNTVYPRFRLSILNPDDTVKYEIPREDIILGGSYNENYQNGSRRTMSFSLNNSSGKYTPSINGFWANTRILLERGFEVPDAGITIYFKSGVYIAKVPKPTRSSTESTVSVECSDKFSIFEDKSGTIPEAMEIEEGIEIKQIIIDTLQESVGNGSIYDYQNIIYHPSFEGRKTPAKLSLSAGSTRGSLLLELAQMLSAEIFYDGAGHLVLAPIIEVMSDGGKPVLADYSVDNLQSESFDFDVGSFINRIYVVGASINGHTCKAMAKNDDPSSPICEQRIGIRVGDIINDSNITSDMLAQERADYELRQKSILKTTLNASVFYNPILSVNNIVTFTDDFFKMKEDRYLIQSINSSLDYGGVMTLSVSNINNLPFVA